jgi:hypothetical protein
MLNYLSLQGAGEQDLFAVAAVAAVDISAYHLFL